MGLTELVLTSLFYKGPLQWSIFWAALGTKDRHTCQLVPDCHTAICHVPLMGSASLVLALMHLGCYREMATDWVTHTLSSQLWSLDW